MHSYTSSYFSLCGLLLLLGGCMSMPSDIRDFSATDIPYKLVNQNIETYQDTPIRWGGTVIAIENEADSSLMQVLFYPLNQYGYPQTDQSGEGRFAVKTNKFLDPAIFIKGAEVTITGVIKGGIERTVGNKIIYIPLINAQTIHLWSTNYREDSLSRYYRYGPYPGYYRYPYPLFYPRRYDPFYWW